MITRRPPQPQACTSRSSRATSRCSFGCCKGRRGCKVSVHSARPTKPKVSSKGEVEDALGVPVCLEVLALHLLLGRSRPLAAPAVDDDRRVRLGLVEPESSLKVSGRHLERVVELGEGQGEGGRDVALLDFLEFSHVNDVGLLLRVAGDVAIGRRREKDTVKEGCQLAELARMMKQEGADVRQASQSAP